MIKDADEEIHSTQELLPLVTVFTHPEALQTPYQGDFMELPHAGMISYSTSSPSPLAGG